MAMTYAEQLRHPNWQRKRLERLEAAGWECENCGEQQNTLHVHHRQYFKNRMAWEYEDDDLSVLCDGCHSIEHIHIDSVKRYLARANTAEVLALVGGFYAGSDDFPLSDPDGERSADPCTYAAGFIAAISSGLSINKMLLVAEFAASLAHAGAYSRRLFSLRGDVFGEESRAEDADGEASAESHPA